MEQKTSSKDNYFLLQKPKLEDEFFAQGKGSVLISNNKKTYFDFTLAEGSMPLGYESKVFSKTLKDNKSSLFYSPNNEYSPTKATLAGNICRNAKMDKILFAKDYKEGAELAVRLARRCFPDGSPKCKVAVVAELSFDGVPPKNPLTKTILKASYNKEIAGGYKIIRYNDIDSLRTALADKTVCAVMLKTVQAYGGVFAKASNDFMKAIREFTLANDQLLIIDENETAGRLGRFMSYQAFDITPDIVVMGKNLSQGLPFGVVCCNKKTALRFNSTGLEPHIKTSHLTYALANTVVLSLSAEAFEKNCKTLFMQANKQIEKIKNFNAVIKSINRFGSFIKIEFNNSIGMKVISATFEKHRVIANFPEDFTCLLSFSVAKNNDLAKGFSILAKICQSLQSQLFSSINQ